MTPQSLNLLGGTQPEIYRGTVDFFTQKLITNPALFWQAAMARDGPIVIWEINGERWLYNGNHRYQAALQAGVEIPDSQIKTVDMSGTTILTWRFDEMIWLAGIK